MGEEKNLLEELLQAEPSKFGFILENAEKFRFQALLSYVEHDSIGRPFLVRHGYRLDHEYFYPASAIKLCAAVAALVKLEHLQKSLGIGITCRTPLVFYPLQEGEEIVADDASNIVCGKITIAHELRKLFLVSDNTAYNRLYAFAGQRYINETMWKLGLKTSRLRHRLSLPICNHGNVLCEPIEINFHHMSLTLPPKKSGLSLQNVNFLKGIKLGDSHISANGDLVQQPMDFCEKNSMSLLDLQNLMVKIFRKDVELDGGTLNLSHDLHMVLSEAMAEYPSSSCNPLYSKSEFPDDYCKFLLPGLCRVRPKGALRVFNKVGRAYGFTIENAYVFDEEMCQGFFLSAVVYTNSNGVLNDDKYDYADIADKLMADIGEMVARAVWNLPPHSEVVSSSWKNAVRVGRSLHNRDEDPKIVERESNIANIVAGYVVEMSSEQTFSSSNEKCAFALQQHHWAEPHLSCNASDPPLGRTADISMTEPNQQAKPLLEGGHCYNYFRDE